jgi:hydroxymethylbilane synthase
LKIATRASKLAMAQAELVRQMLAGLLRDCSISFEQVSTKGDRDRSDFLYKSESIGFFTSEVEHALLDGKADIAVHSLKDLPTALTEGLMIAAIPPRQPVNDCLVAAKKLGSLDDLPQGAVVGTSSLRRIAQLKALRPDLNCQPLRGNVETRINKVYSGELTACVLAQAGLNRLGLADAISYVLPLDIFLPAPGQGALGIQIRHNDSQLHKVVSKLDNHNTRLTTNTERRILAGLHGGCSIPLGVFCSIDAGTVHIRAVLSNTAGTHLIRKERSCPVSDADQAADEITRQILDDGGTTILDELRREKNK